MGCQRGLLQLCPSPGMMLLFWVMLWSLLRPLACVSDPDRCTVYESSSLHNKSPLLRSLQCYNDYKSYVHCEWSEHKNTTRLQLWFKTNNNRQPCLPYGAAMHHGGGTSEHRTVQCRYNTSAFSIGIKHAAFFLKEKTEALCSSVSHRPLDLSHHLRSRPPVNLSTHDAGDGGRQLAWSSPYPSSSALSRNSTYQLSYRTDRQDNWTTETVMNTSMTLERRLLLPGCRYEFRVRARASVGQWSPWSPAQTWQAEEGALQFPSLHCVLDGEKEVVCSWEVSRKLAHFISYQLACRSNQTAPSESCCVNPTVTSDPRSSVLEYSCLLTVADPAHLLLELLPTHSGKIFKANQHIRPDPPQQVNVKEKGSNWMVGWTHPSTATKLRLFYQLCYSRIQDQLCSIRNISEGSMSSTILGASLAPSQDYRVKIRSLVVPGEDSIYRGIPSEWTDPVDWKSHEATWSSTSLIYFFISVFVAIVFLALYCTIQACQRRVILWVDSVPSPGKSKILSEIKSATSWTHRQSENPSMCTEQHLAKLSTRTSDSPMWPTEVSGKKSLERDKGCWEYDNLPFLAKEVKSSKASAMSFSGPYIICQASESKCRSEKEKDTLLHDSASPSPMNFTLCREGYGHPPRRVVSRSTLDLASHSDASTNTHRHSNAEQEQHHPGTILWPDKMDDQAGTDEPATNSGPFPPWPEGGTIQASGYCHLPTA